MQDTRRPPGIEPARSNRVAKTIGWLASVVAAALTAFTAYGIYDYASSEYVGGEVAIARYFLGFVALFMLVAWFVAIGLLRRGAGSRN